MLHPRDAPTDELADEPAGDCQHALALGAEGLSRQEIVAALGLTLAEAAAREAGDAGFAHAMALAAERSRAWWEALPRLAWTAGASFNQAGWRQAMAARFPGWGQPPARPRAPLARYNIPDNGRTRRPPVPPGYG